MAALPLDDLDLLAPRYAEALADFLQSHAEEALYQISLLSRDFVDRAMGPEELVGMHVQTLQRLTQGMSPTQRARASVDAHQALLEVMTAYGMYSREALERHLGARTRAAETRTAEVRRQARQALASGREQRALAAERAAILEQIAEGVVVTDTAGRVLYANTAACQLHGNLEVGEALTGASQPFSLLTMDEAPYPPADFPLARAVQHGETVTDARWRIRRTGGEEMVAEGSASPVTLEDGTRYGSVLVLHDASAQHALELEKDSFLSSISHDLKNPLTAIIGTAQLLRRRLRAGALDPERAERQLAAAESAASQMVEQLDTILDVARTRLGRPLDLVRQPLDLLALVRQTVAAHQAASERHEFVVRAETDALPGVWDGVRLRRVLNNLLSNAVRYSPDGGTICVAVRPDGDLAEVAVSDQGVGIPQADVPHVFERFRRGSNVQGRIAGTGIGLADVLQVVTQHGGTVRAQSQEGRGSTFTVRLPLGEPPPLSAPPLEG